MMGGLKKGWPIVVALIFPSFLQSQNGLFVPEGQVPSTLLKGSAKISWTDMVDPFGPVFGMAFEQKIANRMSVQLEGGYLSTFDGRYFIQRDLEGYKIRGEFRIYDRDDFSLEGVSYGLQLMYKNDWANENGGFQRGGGSFFQNLDYRIEREVIAGHFMTNIMFPTGGKSFLEFSVWAGLRRLVRTYEGVPDDAELVSDFGFFVSRDPGTFVNPSLGVALRLGLGW